jgi:hypothetical protein
MEEDIVERCESGGIKKITSCLMFLIKSITIIILIPIALSFDCFLTLFSSSFGFWGSLLSYFLYPLLFWRKKNEEGQMLCMFLLVSHLIFTFMIYFFSA